MKAFVSWQLGPQQQGKEPYRPCFESCPYCAFHPMLVPMSQIGSVQRPSHSPSGAKGFRVPFPLTKETVPLSPAMLVEFEKPDDSQATADDLVMACCYVSCLLHIIREAISCNIILLDRCHIESHSSYRDHEVHLDSPQACPLCDNYPQC
jgi:hypothetical protein